jgi:hypothetical protein
VAVTDGTRHPGKAAVDESRAAAVASSIASITPLLAAVDELCKASARRR